MILNKDITIDSIETKTASTGNVKYTIKDTEGNKYSFYRTIKGTDGDVYLSFTGMDLKKGSTAHIGYVEEDESFENKEGRIVTYKKRNIVGLREANGHSTPASQPKINGTESADAQVYKQAYEATQETKDDNFWDKKAYKQCLWNFWLANTKVNLEGKWEDVVWDVFNHIEQDAEKRFGSKALEVEEPPFFN